MNEEKIMFLINKYPMERIGDKLKVYNIKSASAENIEFIQQHKEEILKAIDEKKEQLERRTKERLAKIEAIEGLAEIEAAQEDLCQWRDEFNASFEGDCGGFCREKPEYNLEEMYKKYPRAAAYLKAQKYAYSSYYRKSEIGRKALEAIINGEDYKEVINQMEKEFNDIEHIWD